MPRSSAFFQTRSSALLSEVSLGYVWSTTPSPSRMITKTPSRASSLTSSACRVCPDLMISRASSARLSAVSSTVESTASLSKMKSATPRTRSIAPITRVMNNVRRHLIGKCSHPLQGVAPPDGADQLRLPGRGYLSYSAHLFFLTFLEERVASILSSSYQCIYTLHAQRAGCILK